MLDKHEAYMTNEIEERPMFNTILGCNILMDDSEVMGPRNQ